MAFATSDTRVLLRPFRRRIRILAVVMGLGLLVLLGRLVQLQILESQTYRRRGEARLQRLVQIPPARGRILDRKGVVLAEDRPSFDLWITPARRARDPETRKRITLSNLGDLSPERLSLIWQSQGEPRRLERKLALRYLTEASELVQHLATLLKAPAQDVALALLDAATDRQAASDEDLLQPRLFWSNITESQYLAIERAQANPHALYGFPGIETHIGFTRAHLSGDTLGHITGYVGTLTAAEYDRLRGYWKDDVLIEGKGDLGDFFRLDPEGVEASIIHWRQVRRQGKLRYVAGYFNNEMVGRSGVERWYNQWLRGHHAYKLLRMERSGKKHRAFVAQGETSARNGKDIALTIDLDLQRDVQTILQEELVKLEREHNRPLHAVCILMDAYNGRIYAMVSEPGYDPADIRKNYKDLLADPRRPLVNHAISENFPPGSVFKPVVALAGLQERKINRNTIFNCDNCITLGNHDFIEMRRAYHGDIDVTEALQISSNIFFYRTGGAVGGKKVYQYAWDLGFGRPTGIDIFGEASGSLPLKAQTGRGWALGNTYHLSIGQGPIAVTPLQIAVAYAAIANGGTVVTPHVRYDPAMPQLDSPRRRLRLDPAALETVREGMWKVVQMPHGTAHKTAAIDGFEFAGKTGSAEWKKGQPTHAWFAGFAPFDHPRIVFVMLVPEGNFGGHTCGPIMRRVLMKFFGITESRAGEEGSLG